MPAWLLCAADGNADRPARLMRNVAIARPVRRKLEQESASAEQGALLLESSQGCVGPL
jgi:hypothetical protein